MGKDSGPEDLRGVIAEFLHRSGLDRPLEAGKLGQLWAEVAGRELSKRTRVVGGLRGGVLRGEVDCAALLSELSSFEGKRLLAGMQEKFKKSYIRKIQFLLGAGEKEEASQRKGAKSAKDGMA